MKCNKHLAKIGSICCQKIIPLVFDQSYSYYEQLCAFATKLNEIICAVNEQNLTIADFENRISLAFDHYKSEMNLAFADFQIEVNQKIDEFTTEIRDEWRIYRETLNLEFTELKNANQQFKTDMQTAWSSYQTQISSTISNFMTAETTARTNFETAQTHRQNNFERAQTTRQTNFENILTNDWATFQTEIESEMDLAKNKYYITYPGAYSALQTDPPTISTIAATFDFNSNIVRVFKAVNGKITLVKRCLYGDIDTDPDIPFIDGQGKPIAYYVAFENPVVKEFFKSGITVTGTPSIQSGIQEIVVQSIPYITDDLFAEQPQLLAIYNTTTPQPADIPTTLNPASTPYPSTNNYNYIVLTFNQMKTSLTITQPTGATTKVFPGFIYDAFSGGIIRDPELVNLLDNIIPFALQRGEYTLNDQSVLTFDTLTETKYYRYTASAIGNPVPGGYGIIVNIRFTAYAVQLLFSQTTASTPTQLLYRIGTDMNTTPNWRAWRTVGSNVKTLTYTGDGGNTTTINFPDTPTVILSIDGPGTGTDMVNLASFRFGAKAVSGSWSDPTTSTTKSGTIALAADTSGNTLLLSLGANVGSRCNVNGETYTVSYI